MFITTGCHAVLTQVAVLSPGSENMLLPVHTA